MKIVFTLFSLVALFVIFCMFGTFKTMRLLKRRTAELSSEAAEQALLKVRKWKPNNQ